MKVFHKYIAIFRNEDTKIQMIDFIRFLEILPFCFSATNSRSGEDKNRINSLIFCSKCTNIKIFKTIVNVSSNYAEIKLHALCTHMSAKNVSQIENYNTYLINFHEDKIEGVYSNDKRSPSHPFRVISQKLLKNNQTNKIIREYLSPKVYSRSNFWKIIIYK